MKVNRGLQILAGGQSFYLALGCLAGLASASAGSDAIGAPRAWHWLQSLEMLSAWHLVLWRQAGGTVQINCMSHVCVCIGFDVLCVAPGDLYLRNPPPFLQDSEVIQN